MKGIRCLKSWAHVSLAVAGIVLAVSSCAPGAGSSAFWSGFWEGYNGSTGTPANSETYANSYAATNTYGTVESRIASDFSGLQYGNIYALANGQAWEQTEYYYHYRYAYRPRVTIYSSYGSYKMLVEGISHPVTVRRLR